MPDPRTFDSVDGKEADRIFDLFKKLGIGGPNHRRGRIGHGAWIPG
ncbi:MAG: hypothetical protein ACKVIW_09420 [bacterium]